MLSKILSRWLTKTSTNDEKSQFSNLPKHHQAHLLVQRLAATKGRPFNPVRAGGVILQTVDADVIQLTTRIVGYVEKLELSQGLTQKDCFAEVKTVTLDKFFTDAEGMYIPLDTLSTFLNTCDRLFQLVERGLERKDRNVEYSVRLMSKCFSSIYNVCRAVETAGT